MGMMSPQSVIFSLATGPGFGSGHPTNVEGSQFTPAVYTKAQSQGELGFHSNCNSLALFSAPLKHQN